MDVRAEAVAGAVAVADDLALGDLLTGGHREGLLMRVAGGEPAAVIDAGEVAVAAAARLGLGEDQRSRCRRTNRSAAGHGDIYSLVELGAAEARAEAGDDRTVDRPDQPAAVAATDRAGRQRRRAGARQRGGEFGLDRGDVAIELLLGFGDLLQRRLALSARRDQGRLAPLHGRAGIGERLLFGGDRVAGGFDPVLGGAQTGDGALHLIP